MNMMQAANLAPTMSSREMAELTEKRHDSVKRTIVMLAQKTLISYPQCVDGIPGANGVAERVYHVGKRDSYVVVAQLSPEFTARLVDRWQELESGAAQPAFQVPENFAEALRLAADQQEMIQQQAMKIAAAAPAVEFVDRYVDSTGSKGFREVCKLLRVKENIFRDFLKEQKIMYRLAGNWVAYADHLAAGRFSVHAGTSEASGHAFNSAKFTPKGINWIAGEWAKHQIKEAV